MDEDAYVLNVLETVIIEDLENYNFETFGLVFGPQDTMSAIIRKWNQRFFSCPLQKGPIQSEETESLLRKRNE